MALIVKYYIEVGDKDGQIRLERVINQAGFGFYDSGEYEESSLELIEAREEDK